MSDANIITVETPDSDFWLKMGPMFADPEVRKEKPDLYHRPGYCWLVVPGSCRIGVAAFAAAHIDRAGTGHIHSLYVRPECRGAGNATALITQCMVYLRGAGAKLMRAKANASSRPIFEKLGFTAISTRGAYTIMECTK